MPEFLETTFDKFIFKVKVGAYYSEDDYWVDIDGLVATVGITDYLQKSSGDVAFIEPAAPGKIVKKGEEIGEVETIKVTLSLLSPVSGMVIEVNSELESHPELINSDPYGAGWICRIELLDPEGESNSLLKADEYMDLMQKKIERDAM
jgi:glycine cleavage system H protein